MMQEVFNTFDEVKHIPLRVYNRMVTSFNIMEDYGPQQLQLYYDEFSRKEREQIIDMMAFTKLHGREAAKKFATEFHEPEENDV